MTRYDVARYENALQDILDQFMGIAEQDLTVLEKRIRRIAESTLSSITKAQRSRQ
jgi:hypothetical protein